MTRQYRPIHVAAFFFLAVLGAAPTLSAAESRAVRHGDLEARWDGATRTLTVSDLQAGRILQRGVVSAQVGGRTVATSDRGTTCESAPNRPDPELVLRGSQTLQVNVRLLGEDALELVATGPFDAEAKFEAEASAGERAMPAILQPDQSEDRRVLTTVLGAAPVPRARSLFDPLNDLALTAEPAGGARWEPAAAGRGWRLCAAAGAGQKLLVLKLHRQYYWQTLGIQNYCPIDKRSFWTTAPVVAMTWYGVCGMKQPQSFEVLKPEIDWVAHNLLPYADSLVFQLDDNYHFADDKEMRAFSDYIRGQGLIPGIWLTPFTCVPPKEAGALYALHPDWFLQDAQGQPMRGFGGRNWGGVLGKGRSYLVNVSQPEALEQCLKPIWQRASQRWNYDFFKIDGQPLACLSYLRATNGGGPEAYRRGLAIARQIVGAHKFINACEGKNPFERIGLVNGSRTGGDTGRRPHAMDVLLRWNYINNVCLWCDPDAAAVLFDKPLAVARLNAQARALTGQQFLTDDYWTKVPAPLLRVWQQSFPTLDIRPVNLYPIQDDWQQYDLFDLRIAKPWGRWDVAGLFNFEAVPGEKTLDLSRLPLEAEQVHVFEFWSQTYLGVYGREAKIARRLAPNEGQLFAVVPAVADRPVLVSTSRHFSQGGLDLEKLEFQRQGQRWIVLGKSTHLVKDAPCELVFARGNYSLAEARGGEGITWKQDGPLARVTLVPRKSGALSWRLIFKPQNGNAQAPAPSVERGGTGHSTLDTSTRPLLGS